MSDAPTREDLLQLFERVYGSRPPDFEAERRWEEAQAQIIDEEVEEEKAREAFRRRLEASRKVRRIAEVALDSCDELDGEARSEIMDFLSQYEQQLDRNLYQFGHRN